MEMGRIELPCGADGAPFEERAVPRFTLLIRAAKLIAAAGEFVCVIRDVSENGVSLRGFHPLPEGGPHWLELQSGERHAIAPIWSRGTEAGFAFAGPVDIAALIAEVGHFPKRRLRLGIGFPAELGFIGGRARAEVVNLSQQGARIACDALLALDQPVRLCSDLTPDVEARVRWRADRDYGLVFDDTFSLSQLALFAAAIQCPGLLAPPIRAAAARR
jgi:hypothetical protein